MMVHLDASRHGWLPQLPMQDLVVAMDDADGRILYARFVPEENTASTLAALKHLLRTYGRFAELYTDRASHFCYTPKAGTAPTTEPGGAVNRALKVLGIRQGRLPPELRVAGSGSYEDANTYLEQVFVPDFNRRFTVPPAQPGRAFLPLVGVDLELLLSEQHARTVQNDSPVSFKNRVLQPAAHPRAGALRALPGHRARVSRGRIGDQATRGGCWAATRPTGNCSTCRQPRAPSGENPHDLVQRETRVVLVASFLGYPRASRASPLAYHHPVPPANRRCPVQPERTSLTANDPDLCTCQ